MEHPVLIIGANAIGKAVLDIFSDNGVIVYGFLDSDEELQGQEIAETTVLGSSDDEALIALISDRCEYFIASDDNLLRDTMAHEIEETQKRKAVNAIHSKSIISGSAELGHGNLLDSGANIKAFSKIGDGCNIQSGVIIGVEAELGDYIHVGPGSVVQDGVRIENNVFIGAGATIVSGVTIRKNARIGAGSVVISNVGEGQTVFGNPAKEV